MKYRIKKEIEWCTLKVTYIPQFHKTYLFIFTLGWCDFIYNDWICSYIEKFETHEKALNFINKYKESKMRKQLTSFSYYYY